MNMEIIPQNMIIYNLDMGEELRICVLQSKLQPRYILSEIKNYYWTGLELMDCYHNPIYLFEKLNLKLFVGRDFGKLLKFIVILEKQ